MWRLAILALALVGCGRFGFDPVDAGVPDLCTAELVDLGPWGAPVPLDAVNSPSTSEDDPAVSADQLELFFTAARADTLGAADVYVVRRASTAAAWSSVEHVEELSSSSNENTPELSHDGLTIYLATDRAGAIGKEDIFVATRPDRASPWTTPVPVPELNSTQTDRGPSLYMNDLAMIFHSDRSGGVGGSDLYVTTRPTRADPWAPPALLGSVNTIGTELRPWMSPCGLELYFQRVGGATDMDFFVTRRLTIADPFGPAVRDDELSSAAYDQDLRISEDRHTALFASQRCTGCGGGDIYLSTR